jgi:hypothetical protein
MTSLRPTLKTLIPFAMATATAAIISVVSVGPASSQALQDFQKIMTLCGNPALSHQSIVAQLKADNWAAPTSNRSLQNISKHAAAGLSYNPGDASWKSLYQSNRKAFLKLAKLKKIQSPLNKKVFQEISFFERTADFKGTLVVDEFYTVTNQSGGTLVIGRECHFNFEEGPVADGLALIAATPDKFNRRKLSNRNKAANGHKFRLSGYIKSLPTKGMGFKPTATEFLALRLSR